MARDPTEWFEGLVVGAANALRPDLTSLMTVDGTEGTYEIFGTKEGGKPILDTGVFRIYPASLLDSQLGFMKIAVSAEHNEVLEQEADLLGRIKEVADEIEHEDDKPFNYGAFFPQAVETIDAKGRVALMLGFDESISTYQQLTPLSLIVRNARIDLQTAVWILGKQLKILDFLHRQIHTSQGRVVASNVLLEPDQHGILYLDFTAAEEDPSDEECRSEVSKAAEMTWRACGGDETTDPLYDADIMTKDKYEQFLTFLRRVINEPKSAIVEHEALYALAVEIWGKEPTSDGTGTKRPFHPFKTYPK